MKNLNAIGLMSGTSLDGLDICYGSFSCDNNQWKVAGLITKEVPYNSQWQSRLEGAFYLSDNALYELALEFSKFMATEVKLFIKENDLQNKVDLIASHGHTVFHEPHKGVTVQIGDGKTLANETGVLVVNDFRIKDVKLGGQGAPLVPIGDLNLFGSYEACLNLGGIANISFDENGKRIAFDICPANLPLNKIMKAHFNLDYDKNGVNAQKGKVNAELLVALNELDYYKLMPPKSLGVEWLKENFYPILEQAKFKQLSPNDFLRTLVVHEASQIAQILNNAKLKNVMITGGGAFNTFLIQSIKELTVCNVVLPSPQIISFKEALIFGFLGVLNLNNEVNTLKSVTGAMKDSVGGYQHHPSTV